MFVGGGAHPSGGSERLGPHAIDPPEGRNRPCVSSATGVLVLALLLWPLLVATAEESADLSLTNTASPSPVQATTTLTYNLNVFNHGPTVVATGVQVTDTLPPGVTLVSATFNLLGGAPTPCTGTTMIICNLGTLTMGGGAAVTIVVRPQAPGELSNTATVSGTEEDPDLSNNTVTAVTLVVEPPSPTPTLTDPNLAADPVVTGLTMPTGMAFLGPQDFLVLEKSTGRVKHVVDGVGAGGGVGSRGELRLRAWPPGHRAAPERCLQRLGLPVLDLSGADRRRGLRRGAGHQRARPRPAARQPRGSLCVGWHDADV